MRTVLGLLGAALLSTSAVATPITVIAVSSKPGAALPMHIGGRVERTSDGYRRQWPGTYFE
ncbi:hypothetical protein AB2C78_32660, partial [Pseudomonas aeruginosa]